MAETGLAEAGAANTGPARTGTAHTGAAHTGAAHTGTAHIGAAHTDIFDVRLVVNGIVHTVAVPARRLLSDCLRHDLRLTGTHVGCEHGVCGACTVLVDGVATRSCLMLAVSADNTEITTVEGLAEPDGTLSPVQQAFADCHGLQCGF